MINEIFLIGDSQMNSLRLGAQRLNISTFGGPIMPANMMNRGGMAFDPVAGVRFQPIPNWTREPSVKKCVRRFQKVLAEKGYHGLGDVDIPVICNLGCRPLTVVKQLAGYSFSPIEGELFISKGAVKALVLDQMGEMLQISKWIHDRVPKFCFVSPPVPLGVSRTMWLYFEHVVFEVAKGFGAKTYSPSNWACSQDPNGGLLSEFRTGIIVNGIEDVSHGNAEFGARVVRECISLME